MPQVINRQSPDSQKKPVSSDKAVVKQKTTGSDGERKLSPMVLGGAGVALLVFVVLMYHLFVNPVVSSVKTIERVPPLPGFADQYPYNSKEWQEAYKAGRATPISGVPRGPAAQAVGRQ